MKFEPTSTDIFAYVSEVLFNPEEIKFKTMSGFFSVNEVWKSNTELVLNCNDDLRLVLNSSSIIPFSTTMPKSFGSINFSSLFGNIMIIS